MTQSDQGGRYRIIHWVYYDDKASFEREHWQVQKLHQTWRGEKWKSLTTRLWSSGGTFRVPTKFDSKEDAEKTIERLLDGLPREEWVSEPV